MDLVTPTPTGAVGGGNADRNTSLNYVQWDECFKSEKPYEVISELPDGYKKRNFSLAAEPEQTIRNIRGREHEFNLDDHAFEVRRHKIEDVPFDKGYIERHYLPTVVALLQTVDPGAEVYIFDWRVRCPPLTPSDRIAPLS
ncbi:uncharacterized protein DNG_04978 [Cephalotrichum gorgonifer]|uniref:Uncharacterized protein n=1 Tax=Cephalotrichum gorgonifer TaxID=2041049 RepID=A0AAE8MZX0_9PEZI|nr:uncharacterized protein DNG_04978 [Cephalotrichum gorgonifer]